MVRKMTFAEIKELSGMGFTPEQIMALSGNQNSVQEEETVQDQVTDPVPVEPEQPETRSETDNRIEQMQNQINNLIKQMQSNNLKTASVDFLPEEELQRKTDEAMAELIRPAIKKEGNNP